MEEDVGISANAHWFNRKIQFNFFFQSNLFDNFIAQVCKTQNSLQYSF